MPIAARREFFASPASLIPDQVKPASEPSRSASASSAWCDPVSLLRESQRFQTPVTVFTVNSAPRPAAPALCAASAQPGRTRARPVGLKSWLPATVWTTNRGIIVYEA